MIRASQESSEATTARPSDADAAPASTDAARWLLIDITRTVMRAAHAAPTGIDRVERAYLDWAFQQERYRLAFVCRIRGGQALFDREAGEAIFAETAFRPVTRSGFGESRMRRRWRGYGNQWRAFWRSARWIRSARSGRAALKALGVDPAATIVLNVSHNNIDPHALRLFKEIGLAKIVAFVHDVIPADFPEFVAPSGVRTFSLKLDGLARYVDGFIFNSQYTAERTMQRLAERGAAPEATAVGYLGLNDVWDAPYDGPPLSTHPYFVTLGTIEPRKKPSAAAQSLASLRRRDGGSAASACDRLAGMGE